jgi:serine/threonine-protein kinase RsbT
MKHAGQSRQRHLNVPRNGEPSEGILPGSRETPGSRLSAVPSRIESCFQPDEIRIPIGSDVDIVKARQEGRRVAGNVGFSMTDLVLVATAISELARNIVRYARKGEIAIRPITNSAHRGIEIVARDEGPGIKDVEQVLQVGFSTSGGLGLGLPGVRRLMDEFLIQSKLGHGTTVITKKWKS